MRCSSILNSFHRVPRQHSLAPPPHSSNGSTADIASLNGASAAEQPKESSTTSTIEMFIATSEELHDGNKSSSPGLKRSSSMQVPPPRSMPPRKINVASQAELPKASSQGLEMRSLKNELGVITADLREAALDLKDSQQKLRAREGEIILLKAALAGRDINLRNSKAELTEAQSSLKEKDSDLEEAYQQLMSNAQERGSVRQQLLQTQAELAEARSELSLWTQNAGSNDGAAKNETKEQDTAQLESGSSAKEDRGSELASSVATLMDSLRGYSAQLAKDAVADEQAFKI